MKTLLEFFTAHFSFLYLDPRYHITNSRTSGAPTIDAGLSLTGPVLSWSIHNNRGKLGFGIAPTALASSSENWFRISVIRQHLDDFDEMTGVDPVNMVTWTENNLSRIEEMFSSTNATKTSEELVALENALADKYFGPSSI